MKFSRFLYSESALLCAVLFCTIGWTVYAILAGAGMVLVLLTDGVVILGMGIGLCAKFFITRKRIARIERLQRELKEGYLLGETLSEPVGAVEEEYFRVMKFVSRAAIDAVEREKREQEEYRDYVERWVHEIKTPLTACSLILANGGDGRKARAELKRAENLTESVLYYVRLRTAEEDRQITKISVHAVADEAIQSEMELLLAARVRVENEGEFETYTDARSLLFILKQLLVNCAKYCAGGQVKITAEGGVLRVEDDGEGIPSHELPRVFARGFVGEAGRKHGGGTGMGLYLVHELCEKLGVRITVESETGKFTRFSLLFPDYSSNLTKM